MPKNSRSGPAPSIVAASSSSRGTVAMKARNSRIVETSGKNDHPRTACSAH
jgi:hypothetical protein